MTTPRHARRGERGVALVLVALIVFGVFGLAAVTVDLGLARATQASMQNAADVAALEGLRLRDDVPGDPLAADAARRRAASRAAARVYDDDAVLATENTQVFLSAGPSVELTGGTGALNASAQIALGAPYLPDLQTNDANAPHGDLVAGFFVGGPALEAADYLRNDFAVVDPDDAPGAGAFLARLRRTHDPLGLDAVDGVSSSAPGLPYVFGQGSTISAAGADYDPRRDGITVRATAIADARRALRCGPALGGLPGLLPVGVAGGNEQVLALDLTAWDDTTCLGGTFGVSIASVGTVTARVPGAPCDGTVVGRAAPLGAARRVGGLVGPAAPITPGVSASAPRVYAAITRALGGDGQVVGFAALDVVSVVSSGAQGGPVVIDVTLTRVGPVVAPTNASAHATAARTALTLDADLAAAHASLIDPLLAPVLAR